MSPRPFLLRLVVPFAVMIVLIISVSGAVIWWAGQHSLRLQQIQDLDRLALLVREHLPNGETELTARQREQVHDLGKALGTRITLIDGSGVVVVDTEADHQTMANHNARPEVIEARARGVGSAVRRSETTRERTVYLAELLDRGKPEGMVVRLSYPRRPWTELGVPVWVIVLSATVSAVLLMALLAWILQRRWIGPVRAIVSAADQMTAGQWQTRVEPSGADEVRHLAARFNLMAVHAEQQLADLTHQHADMRALVDSLPDPILLSDSLGRIAIINAPAAELLQLSAAQAIGKRIVAVVNDEAILSMLEQIQGEAPVTREIRLQRGGARLTYQALATRAKAGAVLLVLRNLSAMAAAAQMKSDFVANAGHELRTPIAAIKAAFETLREVYREDPQQASRCINIVDEHLRRLEEMIGDLLDLSRVERPELKLQVAPIRWVELQAFVGTTMGPMARQKSIELSFADSSRQVIELNSDRRLLELILKNLVQNSIKFTSAGGKVTVALRQRDQSQIVLEVSDTGIGIPPEHLERVFERFYQIDPARSGASGRGTGLGLAIVKHATHALGGSVQIRSTVGVGTTVTCTLPALELSQAGEEHNER